MLYTTQSGAVADAPIAMAEPQNNRQSGAVADAPITMAEPPRSDHELIARVCLREEAALDAIYDRYCRLIYSLALNITQDHAVAEEVVQDVFQSVWQSAGGFHHGASLSAWLIGIARHRSIDTIRSRAYRSRAHELLVGDGEIRAAAEHTDELADRLALRETMHMALVGLLPAQRQVLNLIYYNGLTYEEAAKRLGLPLGTVKSRARLGLLKLRQTLGTIAE